MAGPGVFLGFWSVFFSPLLNEDWASLTRFWRFRLVGSKSWKLDVTSLLQISSEPMVKYMRNIPGKMEAGNMTRLHPSTFSIVAFDPETGDLGVAVQSKFLAVGAVVPYAKANVGAVATQSYANLLYGPRGLELLAQGLSPEEVIVQLTAEDPEARLRQVGIVDAQGRAAAFTGGGCFPWAGHRTGPNVAVQGNILVGADTVDAMYETFLGSKGDLAERLLVALAAGQEAGGDRRGQQSAALLVVREGGSYGGFTDRYIDLRVDDHPRPIEELARLLKLWRVYFQPPREEDILALTEDLTREIQSLLQGLGYYRGEVSGIYDEATRKALRAFAGVENLEERLFEDARIDKTVLEFLRDIHRRHSH